MTRTINTSATSTDKPKWPVYERPPLWYIRPLGDTFGK